MSRTPKDIKKLKQVAEMALDTELAHLAAIKREELPFRQQIENIDAQLSNWKSQTTQNTEFALSGLLGVDQNWVHWAEREKKKALQSLIEVAERREVQLAKTRAAFGKKDALGRLAERMEKKP